MNYHQQCFSSFFKKVPVKIIFENIMHKQLSFHVNNFFSPYLCCYRNGSSTQQALLTVIEKWKNILDKKRHRGAVLMVLSKAFDTLNHDLLTVFLIQIISRRQKNVDAISRWKKMEFVSAILKKLHFSKC